MENFQIDPELEKHQFFDSIKVGEAAKRREIFKILFTGLEDICKSVQYFLFDGEYTLKLENIPIVQELYLNKFAIDMYSMEDLTNNLEGDVMAMLGKLEIKESGLPSIFVIDEAHGLRRRRTPSGLENYDWDFQDIDVSNNESIPANGRSPYNVFRRVFRMFTNTWERIMLVVISTSGQISILLPEIGLDPSLRQRGSSKLIDSFSLVQTYSANSDNIPFVHAEMFPNDELKIKSWQEFLTSEFRREEYFKVGRPLIYGVFKDKKVQVGYGLEAEFDKCEEFKFMAYKLFGGEEYGVTTKIGLLYSMFNFAFGTNFLPNHVSREDLIENHLMTLVEYLDEQGAGYISAGFLPEGVINFLSARYFVEFSLKSLKPIFSSAIKYGLCDIGNFGELFAQFILLRNIFECNDTEYLKVRKMVFQPVLFKDFLLKLAGDGYNSVIEKYFDVYPYLEGSQVSFGYFELFPEKKLSNPFDLMARLLFRGSATTLNKLFPGIDLMIPLVLGEWENFFCRNSSEICY